MVYEVIHKEPIYRTYYASTISFAYIVKIIFYIIKIFLPLIISFATQGLWKKTGTFRERPQLTFEGQYVLLLESTDQYFISSSLPVLNYAEVSHYCPSQLDYQWTPLAENDFELHIDFFMSVGNVSLSSLIYFIFFKYHLDYHSDVEAEVALYDSIRLSSSSTSITVFGRLGPDQRKPFRWREEYYDLLNYSRPDAEYYKPSEIMKRIALQPFNVRLDRKMQFSTDNTAREGQFHMGMRVVVSEDEFSYKCDIWQLLKWAAVQYAPIFLVINYLCNNFLSFLFRNRMVEVTPCCKWN